MNLTELDNNKYISLLVWVSYALRKVRDSGKKKHL